MILGLATTLKRESGTARLEEAVVGYREAPHMLGNRTLVISLEGYVQAQ
jgi:hypothetical protein